GEQMRRRRPRAGSGGGGAFARRSYQRDSPEHNGHTAKPRWHAQGRLFTLGDHAVRRRRRRVSFVGRRARRLGRARASLWKGVMRIASVGAGPAALYFAILRKKAHPEDDIVLYERNAPMETFGWGVVFSDETLSNFEEADKPTHDAITKSFRHWDGIDI